MKRTVGIGYQDFEELITNDNFYIDKTMFIKEWWENQDMVTLITRPRRFGKTLNLSMVEQFFSVQYADRGELFERFAIWQEEKYRLLQGTYPVISLSFANIKNAKYQVIRKRICQILTGLYSEHRFLMEGDLLDEKEKSFFESVSVDMDDATATYALHELSSYLSRFYKKKVLILLDEYDTPMQEAYVYGYWEELVSFTQNLFNATFKTNPYLGRAIMTGITRVSKESIFSDLNNLEVVTATSEKYASAFGFTQEEVWDALEKFGLLEEREEVKKWYDGFTFGNRKDIYNPWSILNYLDKRKVSTYWANTSSNSLVGKLIREGSKEVKETMEDLLKGKSLCMELDEQIVYSDLGENESAIWSLFLASGYLKAEHHTFSVEYGREEYELVLTNREVWSMFNSLIRRWFRDKGSYYSGFLKALLRGDLEEMNDYMARVTEETFSSFDTGKKPSAEPERFYHGFVLGLLAELRGRYTLTSNRESDFGRYDVMLEPMDEMDDAIIIEFKVFRPGKEQTLEDTVKAALAQIEKKKYAAALEAKGIEPARIRKYGFAFEGKRVLIGEKDSLENTLYCRQE